MDFTSTNSNNMLMEQQKKQNIQENPSTQKHKLKLYKDV
jgi:hypothetical protein